MPYDQTRLALIGLTARAAAEPEFRARLLSDPEPLLREAGVPEGVRVHFAEKPTGVEHVVVLPDLVPGAAELSESELEAVAGGLACGTREMNSECGAELGFY